MGGNVPEPSGIRDVYVIAARGDDILLLLRTGTGYKDGQWGPPSGKVEPGETYLDAAARELEEETGLRVPADTFELVHTLERMPDSGDPWIGLFFEVAATETPANAEPHKHGDIAFFPRSALPVNTVDYVRHVVASTAKGERFSVWAYDSSEDSRLSEPDQKPPS